VTNNINSNTFTYTIRGANKYGDEVDTKWKEKRRKKPYERCKRRMIVNNSPTRIIHRNKVDTLPKIMQEHYSAQQRYGYVYMSYGCKSIPLPRAIEEHHCSSYLNVKQQIVPQILPLFLHMFVPDYNNSVKQSNSKPNAQKNVEILLGISS
jgi:hypothetical protein